MKLILFIGHHKVGSSALQTYLGRNILPLLRRGILYPAVEAQGLATLLAQAMKDGARPASAANLPVNLREAHNALAFGMMHDHAPDRHAIPALHQGLPPAADMLMAIRRQIEAFRPETVILAAEVFANFGATGPKLIDDLVRAIGADAVQVSATLRRVDDYMISWHAQRLRFGQKPRSLPEGAVGHYLRSIHFNYRQMIEPWVTRLPQAALRLRGYDQVLAAGGAVQDFLTGHGIDPVPGTPPEPKVNAGLHRGLIEIARQANQALPAAEAHETFLALLQLGDRLDLPPARDVEMYGAATRQVIHDRFAPVADWLDGVAGGPVLADTADLLRLRPQHEHEINRLALDRIRARHLALFPPAAQDLLRGLELEPNFPQPAPA